MMVVQTKVVAEEVGAMGAIIPNRFPKVRAFLHSLPPLHLCYFAGEIRGTRRVSLSFPVFTLEDLEPKSSLVIHSITSFYVDHSLKTCSSTLLISFLN